MGRLTPTFYFRERETGLLYVEDRQPSSGGDYYYLTRLDEYGKYEWSFSPSEILRQFDVIPAADVHAKGLLTPPAEPASSARGVELVNYHATAWERHGRNYNTGTTAVSQNATSRLLKYIADLEARAEKPSPQKKTPDDSADTHKAPRMYAGESMDIPEPPPEAILGLLREVVVGHVQASLPNGTHARVPITRLQRLRILSPSIRQWADVPLVNRVTRND